MDISLVRRLLNRRCTTQSRWEFVNFVLEPYGEHRGRALQAVLVRRREIEDRLAVLTPQHDSLRSDLEAEADQLDQWLDQFSESELEELLNSIEENEARYWAEKLGREAAVDLLTVGRVSKEVMSRAVLLDEDNYRLFAETCGNVAHVINTVSREVEAAQGYVANLPESMPR